MCKKLFFVAALILSLTISAQTTLNDKAFLKDRQAQIEISNAEEYFELGLFLNALPLYRKVETKYGASPYLMYRIGICLLYKSDETEKAFDYLSQVKQKNPKAADIDFFLARAYHLVGRYDEALASLTAFEQQKKMTPELKGASIRLRQYCMNAKELTANPVDAKIMNLGAPVNTAASEYVPVVTSDDSTLLFTYLGPRSRGGLQFAPGQKDSSGTYFEDVFMARRTATGWGEPQPLDSSINSYGHDACIASSNDGQQLLIFKNGPDDNGDIYISQLFGMMFSEPEHLSGNVNTYNWEGSATLSSDGRFMIFASEREGGYGGRDLWMARLQPDGTWGQVKNLGDNVNTPYNDDAPYFHPNGVTMIFSSEGHNSMGGYDIFQVEMNPLDSSFSATKNIGYPINTPGDDKYFILGPDGKYGYYSSGKPGGMGQQDIYRVESDFNLGNKGIVQVSGQVTFDDRPVRATILVRKDSLVTAYYLNSNAATGRYLVNLPKTERQEIVFELDGVDRKIEILNADSSVGMKKKEINVAFYSDAFKKLAAHRDSVDRGLVAAKNKLPVDSATSVNGGDFTSMMNAFGNAKADSLMFRVQIAAYNFPQNYKFDKLMALGPIEKIKLDDGITRFTIGRFETLAEAEAFRQKVIAAGVTDAFVTAEKKGKRYLLSELVELRFFQQ
jgi:hypothetical protein